MGHKVVPVADDVWMMAREHPTSLRRSTQELADALEQRYGSRFAVWRTDEFVFGVRAGKLVLRTLGGADVPSPAVVLVRQVPGSMDHDREVTLLRHLERMGATLLNPLDAHLLCRNKIWQLQELALAGLPVPDTLSYATAPLEGVVRTADLGAPYVVKPVTGYQGNSVFLARGTRLLREIGPALAVTAPLVFQQYVAPSHGRDLRVLVVDGKVVAAYVRTSHNGALASNIAQGGVGSSCLGDYPRAESLAVLAARTLGLAIAGVDLLFTATDCFLICEVNSVPGWRPAMTAVVPAILDCVSRCLAAHSWALGETTGVVEQYRPADDVYLDG
ncbi:RimK family alpha-L-glutamate ligase [Nocardia sp. NPDC050710]|uniref:ATP-grasp domain-containing protein n=1 Tax=Nocardia sp. NPDC050710 TaxID=3157220 RepID=UPI0033FE30BE